MRIIQSILFALWFVYFSSNALADDEGFTSQPGSIVIRLPHKSYCLIGVQDSKGVFRPSYFGLNESGRMPLYLAIETTSDSASVAKASFFWDASNKRKLIASRVFSQSELIGSEEIEISKYSCKVGHSFVRKFDIPLNNQVGIVVIIAKEIDTLKKEAGLSKYMAYHWTPIEF